MRVQRIHKRTEETTKELEIKQEEALKKLKIQQMKAQAAAAA